MGEVNGTTVPEGGGAAQATGFSSPPVAARPEGGGEDARARLHELGRKLAAARNRRLMLEYLRLRRATLG